MAADRRTFFRTPATVESGCSLGGPEDGAHPPVVPQKGEPSMSQKDRDPKRDQSTGVDARVARHGGLSYLEIPATDLRQSAAFYENALGWNLDWRGSDDCRFQDTTGHLIGHWVTGRAVSREPGL